MSNIKLSMASNAATVSNGDYLLTYEGKGLKKAFWRASSGVVAIEGVRYGTTGVSVEYPVLGKSLPCKFHTIVDQNRNLEYVIEEYGAIPDPDYFNIIDLDEDGLPIYADTVSEENSIQLYKKPIINGNTLGDRVILKTVDNTPENRMLYKITEPIEIAES